jgi:hypothetical protein
MNKREPKKPDSISLQSEVAIIYSPSHRS